VTKNKPKLELTWIGKENRPKLEPRILLEDPAKSYHTKHRVTDNDIFDNKLIFGDNLLALKALEQDFSGKIKCIYIDPPFNTGAAFEYYDDGVEHSIWLSLLRDRIEILKSLLTPDGVIYIHIDDKEMAYLRILCDEVFGRSQFLNMLVIKTSDPSGHKTVNPSPYSQTEYVLMYAKKRELYQYEQKYVETQYDPGYNRIILNRKENFVNWKFGNLNEFIAKSLGYENTREARKKMGRSGFDALVANHALEHATEVFQPVAISDAAGRKIVDVRDESAENPEKIYRVQRDGFEDIFVTGGRQIYFYSSKVRIIDGERCPAKPLTNLWTDIPWNGIAKEGGVEFKNGKKPEKLIKRCIELATKEGDWVLDSFAGSGTTGAVAHKMGRRWIMVELGEHCHTHIIPRIQRIIDGKDLNGITEAVAWKGGGGFRYYHLAPSLLKTDKWGNLVINKEFNADMLSEAVCKLEGYTYAPSDKLYWQHGHSSEKSFIYVTTQHLTREQLTQLNDEVGSARSLLVCCAAFRGKPENYPSLELKKIPKAVLSKCEWGHDDYSLKTENLPKPPPKPGQQDLFGKPEGKQ
jgi:adenine-specific DNA-methyltransferase